MRPRQREEHITGGGHSRHGGVMIPKTLLSPDAALAAVLEHVPQPRVIEWDLDAAGGFVLAEDVAFDRDYPPFNRAMMDGFGVRVNDAGKMVRVVGVAPAGNPWGGVVEPGAGVEIMTGAPCPPGVEAVVPVENVTRSGEELHLPKSIEPAANIAPQGSEGLRGRTLLPAGTVITPLVTAALASVGVHRPKVYARPRVAVMTTGDELVAPGVAPAWYQLRDSNAPLLRSILLIAGVGEVSFHHATDTMDSLLAGLESAREADIIVLTGGVSAGSRDLVPASCAAEGFHTLFHKVAQKPGKPFLFAQRDDQLLFGLPGNPLAVHLCTHRYLAPAVRVMSGHLAAPESSVGTLKMPMAVKGDRTGFSFVAVASTPDGYTLMPLNHVSSADVFTVPSAHALVRLEPGVEYPAGECMPFEWLWGGVRP